MTFRYRLAAAVHILLILALAISAPSSGAAPSSLQTVLPGVRGQTATELADGRLLVVGGADTEATAVLVDRATGGSTPVDGGLGQPRAWHSATVLPDGRVLIFGGIGPQGVALVAPELFDPARQTFEFIRSLDLAPRAYHTATLLTDGRVLFAGGTAGAAVQDADLWDSASGTSVRSAALLTQPRRGHIATLQPDGTVALSGGTDATGRAITQDEVFDPALQVFSLRAKSGGVLNATLAVAGTLPQDGAKDVAIDTRVALRFAAPVAVRDIADLVSLSGPGGTVESAVVHAEGGRLAFMTPLHELKYLTNYEVAVRGTVVLTFTTRAPADDPKLPEVPEVPETIWTPSAGRNWTSGLDASPWQRLSALAAPVGVTALAGQVLSAAGNPLPGVTLQIGTSTSQTDATGRFLLTEPASGTQVLVVHGHRAGTPARDYGMHEVQIDIVSSRTNVVPFTIWLSPIDKRHPTSLAGPQAKRATTPLILGLEIDVPRNTVLRERNGAVLENLTITPLPADRAPVPLPPGVTPLALFTLQTHGARVEGPRGAEVRLTYPNTLGLQAGAAVDLWNYDANTIGWKVAGRAFVSRDGRRVVSTSDSGSSGSGSGSGSGSVNCLQLASPSLLPGDGPWPGDRTPDGDPVDLGTGLFVYETTDLTLRDVLPLTLTRTYRQNDSTSRAFGYGTSHTYDLILTGPLGETSADLVLPDGGAIHFVRTSPGTGHLDAVMEHTGTRTRFYKSILTWNNTRPGWDISFKDGTVYEFGTLAATGCRLTAIRDRYGNQITIERDGIRIRRIISPHGRYLEFTYDGADRITQTRDSAGRSVAYAYDGTGRLIYVTDARGGVTEFTYDSSHRMLTIEDPRNIVYLTNTYDAHGRVDTQTQADGGIFDFAYTLNGSGKVTQTDVTNPRGYVRRAAFSSQLRTSDIKALGTSVEQTTTYVRVSGTALMEAVTDPLNRVTRFAYDSNGNLTSVTRLYNTSNAVTETATYDATYGLLTSLTDALSHTTSIGYGAQGRLQSVTNALNHQTTFTTNGAGQILSVTDPLTNQMGLGYNSGDLTSTELPSGNTATRFLDAAGRVSREIDARGRITTFEYNAHDLVIKVVHALGGETTFTYDANGNLLTLTDARGKTSSWTYDNMDRVGTRTDPLNRQEGYTYDLNGNLKTWTDRKGQVTTYSYDALDRQTFVGFGTTGNPPAYISTITTTYDAVDRATQIADSGAGTISRTYDLLDRLTEEVTPEGTVNYTYDAADRRATMTVAGQSTISYTYDNADRLTAITQGSAAVSIGYDDASRRTSVTLPNGIILEYAYDNDSNVVGVTYKRGGTTLGTLTYTYDASGLPTSVGGTYARSILPAALSSATYDDANQVTSWGGTGLSYDLNGNLTGDGLRTYTWNARNQLVSLTGPVSGSFGYDALGRRRIRTIGGATTQFLYDGVNLIQELSGGAPTANFLTGLDVDEYFVRTESVAVRNYLTDALGSTIALADAVGTIQTEYTYDPFGGLSTSGNSTTNPIAFTGREADASGLYFYRARYYDPRLQRFIAEDPLGSAASPDQLYAYVSNIPTAWVDPFGLQGEKPPVSVPGGGPNSGWKWNPDPGNPRGGTWGPEKRIPNQSQPSASEDPLGHWDVDDGHGNRQRYDKDGKPITPDEAHKKQPDPKKQQPKPPTPKPPPPPKPVPPSIPWRLPFPLPLIVPPCLLDPSLPGCLPGMPGRNCGMT